MTLTIGPLRAEPGHKTRGSLPADLGPTTAEVPLVPRKTHGVSLKPPSSRSIPRRLREAGLLARVYDRSRPLIQIAPPLISDRAVLDRIAAIIAGTLAEASSRI